MTAGRRTLLGFSAILAAAASPAVASPGYHIQRHVNLAHFDPQQIGLLEKLNRADRDHLAKLPALVIPDEWDLDELAYSPMPAFSSWAEQQTGKVLIIDIPGQVFGAYEDGILVRWGPVSSGRQGNDTPPGLTHLSWRSRIRRSSINQDWIMEWYFNFDPERGMALHQYALPGLPASHACVRLLERDARWLYEWGEPPAPGRAGTPVLIIGAYDHDSAPPWREPERLAERLSLLDPDAE